MAQVVTSALEPLGAHGFRLSDQITVDVAVSSAAKLAMTAGS
jgi:hypothetical protein